jgi:LysM domain-containing protein
MKRTFHILLLVGSIAPILVAIFVISVKPADVQAIPTIQAEPTVLGLLPPLKTSPSDAFQSGGIQRYIQLKTIIAERPGNKVTKHIVKRGDSPWSIAQKFKLKPETILWGNPKLNAAACSLKAGDTLNILPVDGVLHVAKEGDTLENLQPSRNTCAGNFGIYG